jgi:hypothetical protein
MRPSSKLAPPLPRSKARLQLALSVLSAGLLAACSEPASAPAKGPNNTGLDAGNEGDGDGDGDVEEDPDACDEGETDPCVCTDGSGIGTRGCIDGRFGGACTACTPPVNGTPCQPGRYTGEFTILTYLPRAASLCGFYSAFGGSGVGSFQFTLGGGASGSEFLDVVATESCLELVTNGEADGGLQSPDVPQALADAGPPPEGNTTSMGLEGSVDCATGDFKGELKGVYHAPLSVCGGVFGGGEEEYYSTKGTLTARYDPKTQTFVDGVIDIQEPMNDLYYLLPIGERFGGAGPWTGKLALEAPAPAPRSECYDTAHYKDFKLMPRPPTP